MIFRKKREGTFLSAFLRRTLCLKTKKNPGERYLLRRIAASIRNLLGELAGLDTAGRIIFIPEMFAVFAQSVIRKTFLKTY